MFISKRQIASAWIHTAILLNNCTYMLKIFLTTKAEQFQH